jgi:hypothetical protein
MCGLPGHTYDESSFVLCKTGRDRGVGPDELISDLKNQYDYNVPFGCINF